MKRNIWVCATAFLMSCGTDAASPIGTAFDRQSIIGGTPTAALPAVGLLVYPVGNNQFEFCSGTLVAPNKVLTAGHCVLPDRAQGTAAWNTTKFTFSVGETPLTSSVEYATSTRVQTPAAFAQYAPDAANQPVPESFSDSDMAVVTLAKNLQTAPLGWSTSLPAAGTQIMLVGYGLTNASNSSTYGTKNYVMTQLLGLDQDVNVAHWGDATHTNCHGDSGGPALVSVNGAWQVVATVSTGSCAGAGNGPSTKAQTAWLQSVLGGSPRPAPTPTPTPTPTPAPTPTQTGPTAGTRYKILSVSTGGSLDIPNGSTQNGAWIEQWAYWGGTNQQFTLISMGDGTYQIANVNSNACLSVYNASNADGARIQQWQCFGGINQRWRLQAQGNGSYLLIANASNKCLDLQNNSPANGTMIQQWTCWGGANQLWTLTPS